MSPVYNGYMPELPEVETVRIGLQRLLPGRVVTQRWLAVQRCGPHALPSGCAGVETGVEPVFETGVAIGSSPPEDELLDDDDADDAAACFAARSAM